MCANPDKAATEEFRNRTGPLRGYKVILTNTAKPMMFPNTGLPYQPGRNVDRRAVKTYRGYRCGSRRGFHCYLSRRKAHEMCRRSYQNVTVVCVSFDPGDVIVAESTEEGRKWHGARQIVVRALHITKRAWRQAGLPEKRNARQKTGVGSGVTRPGEVE